jgi:hypothetical protein
MSEKFHITDSGDVRPCNARKRKCKYGSSRHFSDRAEALLAIKENENLSEIAQPISKVSVNSISRELNRKFSSDSPEDLISIGEKYEDELKKRLDFDIDGDLNLRQLEEIRIQQEKLFSELVENGDKLSNSYGPLKNKLDDAISVLPNSVKSVRALGALKIVTLQLTKRSSRYGMEDGHFRRGEVETLMVHSERCDDFDFKKEAPDGTFIPPSGVFASEIEDPYCSQAMFVKNGDERELVKVWVGKKPKSTDTKFKKISDKAQVFIDGEVKEINKPVYQMYSSKFIEAAEIAAKTNPSFPLEEKSLLIHEFSHAVQRLNPTVQSAEQNMFSEIMKDKKTSKYYDFEVYDGFPDDYMGYPSRAELLPMSTQAVFYPDASQNDFLYGSNQGQNAAKIRKWVIGFWLATDKRTQERFKNS